MLIKNTLSITATNINLLFKLIAFFLIILLIFFAVLVSIINPIIDSLSEALETNNSLDAHVTSPVLDGDQSISLSRFFSDLGQDIGLFFKSSLNQIVYAILLLCLLLFVIKFLGGLARVPVAMIVAGQMTTNFTDKFFHSFVTNFKTSVAFSGIETLLFLITDMPLTALCIYLAALLTPILGIFSMSISLFAIVVLLAARAALVAEWLPRVVLSGEKVWPALLSALKDVPYSFKRNFIGSLLVFISAFILIITTMLFTFFLSVMIFLPLFILVYISFVMAVYCRKTGQNYYIDNETVIDVKKLNRDCEEID